MRQPLFKFPQCICDGLLIGEGDIAPHGIWASRNARHLPQGAAAGFQQRSVFAVFLDQAGSQRSGNKLRNVADPGAKLIVLLAGIIATRAPLFSSMQHIRQSSPRGRSAPPVGSGTTPPCETNRRRQIPIPDFLSRPSDVPPESIAGGTANDFLPHAPLPDFGAADIGQQARRGRCGANAFNQIDDWPTGVASTTRLLPWPAFTGSTIPASMALNFCACADIG